MAVTVLPLSESGEAYVSADAGEVTFVLPGSRAPFSVPAGDVGVTEGVEDVPNVTPGRPNVSLLFRERREGRAGVALRFEDPDEARRALLASGAVPVSPHDMSWPAREDGVRPFRPPAARMLLAAAGLLALGGFGAAAASKPLDDVRLAYGGIAAGVLAALALWLSGRMSG